jgi:hypothetical protein
VGDYIGGIARHVKDFQIGIERFGYSLAIAMASAGELAVRMA